MLASAGGCDGFVRSLVWLGAHVFFKRAAEEGGGGGSASGLQWQRIGKVRPAQGRELTSVALGEALRWQAGAGVEHFFDAEQVQGFGFGTLHMNDFIRAGVCVCVRACVCICVCACLRAFLRTHARKKPETGLDMRRGLLLPAYGLKRDSWSRPWSRSPSAENGGFCA